MGLEKLTFDVEGVKVHLKPELHKYHDHANDDPFLGLVPVSVEYLVDSDLYNFFEMRTVKGKENNYNSGLLRYDTGKKIFITALSDFVPTDPQDTHLLERYAQGMLEVARVYSVLLRVKPILTSKPLITQKHHFQNSQGKWKDIGDWLGVYTDTELRAMADAVK